MYGKLTIEKKFVVCPNCKIAIRWRYFMSGQVRCEGCQEFFDVYEQMVQLESELQAEKENKNGNE